MYKYTIGCDPELFVYNKYTKKYLASLGAGVKGTKENPFKVYYGATQNDGVAAEFNTDPCISAKEFAGSINAVMYQLERQIGDLCELHAVPVAYFDQAYFNSLSNEERKLGCEADWNAYTEEQQTPPATDEPFRTGSGHVHIGWEGEKTPEDIFNRVKQLDYTLYILSLLWDSETKRRTLYGKPGSFRFKPYGLEYRVLSNKWVGDVDLQKWIFEATVKVMELYDDFVGFTSDFPPEESYTRDSLITYHDMLVRTYKFPPLPSKYL